MDVNSFRESAAGNALPVGLSGPLRGLWHAARGDWKRAHEIVQDEETAEAAWVHAYLHRVEGDASNAGYWYRRAGKPVFTGSLEDEWASTSEALLGTR